MNTIFPLILVMLVQSSLCQQLPTCRFICIGSRPYTCNLVKTQPDDRTALPICLKFVENTGCSVSLIPSGIDTFEVASQNDIDDPRYKQIYTYMSFPSTIYWYPITIEFGKKKKVRMGVRYCLIFFQFYIILIFKMIKMKVS